MGGDADPQHASRLGQGLINRGQDAFFCQLIRAGKSRRAGADNRHLLVSGRQTVDLNFPAVKFIGSQTLQIPDGDRFFNFTPPAGVLATVGAYSPQDTRKRQILHDD